MTVQQLGPRLDMTFFLHLPFYFAILHTSLRLCQVMIIITAMHCFFFPSPKKELVVALHNLQLHFDVTDGLHA
jgi:hypothetical protein